jgi:acetyl esterase/lipase
MSLPPIPGTEGAPGYTAFISEAARNTRTAVLVAPGGGFRQLSINSEGNRVATWLAERGIAAFVVKSGSCSSRGRSSR